MSLHHFDMWICDLCECGATVHAGKLPLGWRWYRVAMGRIGHACGACSDLVLAWAPLANATHAPLGQEHGR